MSLRPAVIVLWPVVVGLLSIACAEGGSSPAGAGGGGGTGNLIIECLDPLVEGDDNGFDLPRKLRDRRRLLAQ